MKAKMQNDKVWNGIAKQVLAEAASPGGFFGLSDAEGLVRILARAAELGAASAHRQDHHRKRLTARKARLRQHTNKSATSMPWQNPNLNSVPAGQSKSPSGESSADTQDIHPAAEPDMTNAEAAAVHYCPRCGQPAAAEFCANCGHRQCIACGD